ncbi:hypothetical protein LCGC14_1411010 [marine sediment metagenome]|uniref:Uncharacterized protein n=1 Tax=marine sediment metagenome TaxID=412755 RepID=A0A0F9MVZ0_9ZZZZ
MTSDTNPIEALRRVLDVGVHRYNCSLIPRPCTCGWDDSVADARRALGRVEAVVESAQRLPDIIEHERHYHRASPDMNEPNRGACKLCREVVRLQAALAPFTEAKHE